MSIAVIMRKGAKVGKEGGRLYVECNNNEEKDYSIIIISIEKLVLVGNITLTHGAMAALAKNGIMASSLNYHGKYQYSVLTRSITFADLIAAQVDLSRDMSARVYVSKYIIESKLNNMKIFLERAQRRGCNIDNATVNYISQRAKHIGDQTELKGLRGLEGDATRHYFAGLREMVPDKFYSAKRSRRPPADMLNALLSYCYAILYDTVLSCTYTVGLHPYFELMHTKWRDRPALALDLMEMWRTPLADSVVLNALNRESITSDDFAFGGRGCSIKEDARRKLAKLLLGKLEANLKDAHFGEKPYLVLMIDYCNAYADFLLRKRERPIAFRMR